MDGWRFWKWYALAAMGLTLSAVSNLHAGDPPRGTDPAKSWEAVVGQLESDWAELREALTQSALEATMTMFFIKPPTLPPTGPQPSSDDSPPPPEGGGDPPPPDPPPPPPEGSGETPPTDPPPPPPPSETPEPASLVTALVGAGLASLVAWRKRRRLETQQ